uniref:Uncharacterized protein n=1 Tax=Hanusia phi TaxID=3032 RepID=A0A7S0HJY7_9CRYP|mmetsp:Transcript_24890/g.56180  ORF Transcript_24890/g.56180 Transcript_24890/m.56180 type:complete len:292 (+) Transcript_24890:69-944(+)
MTMNLRAAFGSTCGVLLLLVIVIYIDGAEKPSAAAASFMQLANSTRLPGSSQKRAAVSKLSALDLKPINFNYRPAMGMAKEAPLATNFVSISLLQQALERLHVRKKVIREAMSAVRLGIIDPETVLNTAKEAYEKADAEDVGGSPIQININVNSNSKKKTKNGNAGNAYSKGSEGDSVEVWQPFPGKDPSKHAIVWRKVLRKKLPVLRPLTEAMDNLTSTRTSSYNASSGNYSFPVPEGAIVLPTAGSHWQLQDIAILHGHAPNNTESSVIESSKEDEEQGSSYVDIEIRH